MSGLRRWHAARWLWPVLTAALVVVHAGAAWSADIGVAPKKLIAVDKLATAGKAKLVFVSKDTGAGITKRVAVGPVRERPDAAGAFGRSRRPDGAADAALRRDWVLNPPLVSAAAYP